jgi:FKBP-type peptidyl-prolyl cis-trans isomerase FklB
MRYFARNAILLLSIAMLISGMAVAEQPAKPDSAATESSTPPALDTDAAKASYAIGANVGKSLRNDEIEIDPAAFVRGLRDGMSGGKMLMTDEEVMAALVKLKQDSRAKREAHLRELSADNEKKGAAFLAANKTKDGVVTLPSGLQYKVVKQGDGPTPTLHDTVVCNYRGTLVDGTEFDSSYKRGQPATFPVSGVIKGWSEILQRMPVGSTYQVFIPSDLAYGERAPASIGPNSTLIFDIELLSIKEMPAGMPPHHPQ